MNRGLLGAGAACAVIATMLAACGAQTPESGASLESWRDAACRIDDSMAPAGTSAVDDPPFSTKAERLELKRMRSAVAELRAIPAPDEHRADVDRFFELLERYADEYEAALPKIEAASRRLQRIIASIDESELPPPRRNRRQWPARSCRS